MIINQFLVDGIRSIGRRMASPLQLEDHKAPNPRTPNKTLASSSSLGAPASSRHRIAAKLLSIACILFVMAAGSDAAETSPAPQYKLALPGFKFNFPADHNSHDEYKTEWWYYTGHLKSEEGKDFGFELTFFRTAIPLTDGVNKGPWKLGNVYMAHFAITDIDGKKFFYNEKLCRPGVATAGASQAECRVWTENWSLLRQNDTHILKAKEGDNEIELSLKEGKPPVLHGENGVSQKASCHGCASHYYSFTRMPASGTLTFAGKKYKVSGTTWMDHEFGSNQLTEAQIGWDWFSIQLEDNTELMLYVMRHRNNKLDPNSSGTIVSADGKSKHLSLQDYKIDSTSKWTSPGTGGKYPSKWQIHIPGQKLSLQIEPQVADQELISKRPDGVSYWEGACKVTGLKDGKKIAGQAYVELTGYAKELSKNI